MYEASLEYCNSCCGCFKV